MTGSSSSRVSAGPRTGRSSISRMSPSTRQCGLCPAERCRSEAPSATTRARSFSSRGERPPAGGGPLARGGGRLLGRGSGAGGGGEALQPAVMAQHAVEELRVHLDGLDVEGGEEVV